MEASPSYLLMILGFIVVLLTLMLIISWDRPRTTILILFYVFLALVPGFRANKDYRTDGQKYTVTSRMCLYKYCIVSTDTVTPKNKELYK